MSPLLLLYRSHLEFLPVTSIRKQTLVCHYGTELVGTLSRQNVSASFFLVAVILATLPILSREPMTIRFTRFDAAGGSTLAKGSSHYRINRRSCCNRRRGDLGIICFSLFALRAKRTGTTGLERALAGMPERSHHSRKHSCLRP